MNRRGLFRVLVPGVLGGFGLAGFIVGVVATAMSKYPVWSLAATLPAKETRVRVGLRPVRVLIDSDAERLWIGAETGLVVRDEKGRTLATLPPTRHLLRAAEDAGGVRFHIESDVFSVRELFLADTAEGAVSVSADDADRARTERRFSGTLRVHPRGADRFDVINEVEIESYVGSVVASEVWPHFNEEAYRAQAIAARTYVVYQMMRREQHPFDVAATQSSQVYRGLRQDDAGRRATDAAQYTRGVLCTYGEAGDEQVFCAYYGAACGGLSQPAAIFGAEGDIAPLAGGVPCDYCKIAPPEYYRWGPVRLAKEEIARRLGTKYAEVAEMEGIRRIDVSERTPTGRPTALRIMGSQGQKVDLLAERFRHAVGPKEIRSTDFQLRDQGSHVVFENGRGFGHGLGLCQWGAQGQARLGRHASDILRHYYPSAKLTRVY